MTTFEKILTFFDGRKAMILSIVSAILSYLVAGNKITPELGALLQTIASVVFGGAVYATNVVLGSRNKFGERVRGL